MLRIQIFYLRYTHKKCIQKGRKNAQCFFFSSVLQHTHRKKDPRLKQSVCDNQILEGNDLENLKK